MRLVHGLRVVCVSCMLELVSSVISLSTSIGRPKHVRVMAGGLEGDLFIGPKAEEHRGLLNIRYPIEVEH